MNKPLFCVEVYKSVLNTISDTKYFMKLCPMCKKIISKSYIVYFKYYDKKQYQILSYPINMCVSCFIIKIQGKPINEIIQIIPLQVMKSATKIEPKLIQINPHSVTPVFSEEYSRRFIRETKRTDIYAEDDFVYEKYAGRPKEYYHE